ncbi:MAG: hypothetical protein EA356_12820 [Geminicoccaceae bacterium]|nr:MAG: hypothetical protein EA356_12820 [Geminicoccaceae bacterium]
MTVRLDPPRRSFWPERVAYASGMLLDDADFRAEQAYHRGRSAMLCRYLFGHGTVAGLNVALDAGPPVRVVVAAGLAIDRVGRLIESPLPLCLDLQAWWDDRTADAASGLAQAFRVGSEGGPDHVLADVFVGFRECEVAKRPAMAADPYDALGAVVPLRLRDAVEATLVLRTEDTPPLPERGLPPLAEATPAERLAALDARKRAAGWVEDDWWGGIDGTLRPDDEHVPRQNPADLFLARLTLPAVAGTPPTRHPTLIPTADNAVRRMSYSTAELFALGL